MSLSVAVYDSRCFSTVLFRYSDVSAVLPQFLRSYRIQAETTDTVMKLDRTRLAVDHLKKKNPREHRASASGNARRRNGLKHGEKP